MPHVSPHPSRAVRSLCRETWSASEVMGRYMRQSSANRHTWELTTDGRSFIWHKNNKGPNTVPWGTPERTGAGGEWVPSITTRWVLSARKAATSLLGWQTLERFRHLYIKDLILVFFTTSLEVPGRVLPLCWVIWMCSRFDPLFDILGIELDLFGVLFLIHQHQNDLLGY